MARFADKYYTAKKNRRLQEWDYERGIYFVTICVKDAVDNFGNIGNGIMHLSETGKLICTNWQDIPNHSTAGKLDEFIVMPNHNHEIIEIIGTAGDGFSDDVGICSDAGAAEAKFA